MNFSYYCHFTTPLSLVVLISMIFACELNPENLIGVRIKPRQTQSNVSFFACANIQFRKPWKSFNYLCTPCPIHQALLFQFGKIHWILSFFRFFLSIFFLLSQLRQIIFIPNTSFWLLVYVRNVRVSLCFCAAIRCISPSQTWIQTVMSCHFTICPTLQ